MQKYPQISLDLLCFLKNRTALDYLLKDILDLEKSYYYSLITMDIDNFKRVNDKFGHDGADEILRMIGRIIQNAESLNENQWENGSIQEYIYRYDRERLVPNN